MRVIGNSISYFRYLCPQDSLQKFVLELMRRKALMKFALFRNFGTEIQMHIFLNIHSDQS